MFPHIHPDQLIALLYSDRGADVWMAKKHKAIQWFINHDIRQWWVSSLMCKIRKEQDASRSAWIQRGRR